MLINATDVESGRIVDADVCIVGAGAAGITIAREFAGSTVNVCLLDGGGLEINAPCEMLNASIRSIGRDPGLSGSRRRIFGGSTDLWGGHCVPLRAINFEPLPWSPHSGWPISRVTLEPYYRRAEAILGFDAGEPDPSALATSLSQRLFPFDPDRVQTQISRYNPVRFGPAFRELLAGARTTRVVLGANVTAIDATPNGRRIERVAVRTSGGHEFSVRARAFILAAGGIENPRLLLASRSVQREGLGNEHDLVGRFFMEHLWYQSGLILPREPHIPMRLYTEQIPIGEVGYRAHLVLPESVVRNSGLPDFRTELGGLHTLRFSQAVRSAKALGDRLKHFEMPDNLGEHLANIIRHPGEVIAAAMGDPQPFAYELCNNLEQAPNPSSRIALGDERDSLGMPIATLDWRVSDIDRQGVRHAHTHIAREVGRSGFGRMFIELPEEERELLAGAGGIGHHMGTTRMHDRPQLGVVDKNCRMHGVENLFIAGSSVFPTCGFANPTFTIVALAVRLADHLKASLRNEE